jgi:hypothetical protein
MPVISSDMALVGTMIHRVAQLIQQRIDNAIGDSGLTRLSRMAAAHVEDSPGLTIIGLAERLAVGRATAGQLVDRMVRGGWVERLSCTLFLWTPICLKRDWNDDVQHEEDRSSFSR